MNSSSNEGLLVVAHGSNLEHSNNEIRTLVSELKKIEGGSMWIAEAFLEKGKPYIPQMLLEANLKGIKTLKVLPCFVTNGVHVSKDLRSICEQAQNEYPEMKIEILPHLGALPNLADFIFKSI